VVHVAGGWLFDQVLAGWDVTVVTASLGDQGDQRSLRILGVRSRDLESAKTWPVLGSCVQVIAVQAELYGADERVRRLVHAAAEAGGTELRLWGDAWPDDFEDRASVVSHRLSAAARAFKAQALAAASAGGWAADTEVFRRGAIRRFAMA